MAKGTAAGGADVGGGGGGGGVGIWAAADILAPSFGGTPLKFANGFLTGNTSSVSVSTNQSWLVSVKRSKRLRHVKQD